MRLARYIHEKQNAEALAAMYRSQPGGKGAHVAMEIVEIEHDGMLRQFVATGTYSVNLPGPAEDNPTTCGCRTC